MAFLTYLPLENLNFPGAARFWILDTRHYWISQN